MIESDEAVVTRQGEWRAKLLERWPREVCGNSARIMAARDRALEIVAEDPDAVAVLLKALGGR